jgi:hypothetical protein
MKGLADYARQVDQTSDAQPRRKNKLSLGRRLIGTSVDRMSTVVVVVVVVVAVVAAVVAASSSSAAVVAEQPTVASVVGAVHNCLLHFRSNRYSGTQSFLQSMNGMLLNRTR